MKASYIVLRDQSRTRRRVFTTDDTVPASEAATMVPFGIGLDTNPPSPKIEVITNANTKDVMDLARDEDALVIARQIPVLQIEPMETAGAATTDSFSGPTWGVAAIGADKAVEFTGRSATVAVIDSGIRQDHVAFAGKNVLSMDFTGTGDVIDKSGHGTHCAATIAGRDVAGRRVGVAPGVERLLIGRIFAPGVATTSDMLVNALNWAVENGANVISMSLNFDFTGLVDELVQAGLPVRAATAQALVEFQNNLRLFDSLMDLFRSQEAFPGKRGAVIVGAAGNQSNLEPKDSAIPFSVPVASPCNANGIISVGALRQAQSGLEIAPFSNSIPTLVAPGVDIFSADARSTTGLISKSGTSMACPHVAGLAALWWDAVSLSGQPLKASVITAKLQASCSIGALNPGLEAGARGLGIPAAPR